MQSFRKIMVAVDFSDHSLASFRQGVKLARDLNAELLLVNVVNQSNVDVMQRIAQQTPKFSVEHYLGETIKDREASFRNLILTNKCAGLSMATRIRIGHPYQELLKAIEKEKPDLLIMGVKGRSNLVETVIGSCAQKMFRRCPIPLLVIR